MQRTYQEAYPEEDFSHLATTVEQYFSKDTPIWWVDFAGEEQINSKFKIRLEKFATEGNPPGNFSQNSKLGVSPPSPSEPSLPHSLTPSPPSSPVACLWVGNAIDQVQGTRHAHIFLLYVVPEHRQRGIGTGLMRYVEEWAKARGDHQIGLQVFQTNTAALNLYNQLGYQSQSLWMVKSLDSSSK
ncbi:GNAT family N-acetyltransferase [Tolypothrix campylonemoides VB511288]|nr:GNAT family N-acetyltransferase [Tolypothrix campylonemoides VB511288]